MGGRSAPSMSWIISIVKPWRLKSLPSRQVTRLLDQVADWRGYPQRLRLDNGSEFIARHFKDWAKQHGILLDFTDPGCPYQNAYVERFNRTFREDVLDATWFLTACKKLKTWQINGGICTMNTVHMTLWVV